MLEHCLSCRIRLSSIMGSSESKMSACAPIKPEPTIRNISHLVDPRSPSVGIDRTPIQVGSLAQSLSELIKPCGDGGDTFSLCINLTRLHNM